MYEGRVMSDPLAEHPDLQTRHDFCIEHKCRGGFFHTSCKQEKAYFLVCTCLLGKDSYTLYQRCQKHGGKRDLNTRLDQVSGVLSWDIRFRTDYEREKK